MYNDISPVGYQSPLQNKRPIQQVHDEQRERDETLAQLPLLRDVLKRLDKQIAKTDSIIAAQQLSAKKGISLETALAALSEVNELLVVERGYIEARISRASKK